MRSLCVLVVSVLAGVLVGCSSPPASTPIEARPLQPASNEPVVIDHLLVIVDSSASLRDGSMFEDEQALVRAYAASVPDGNYEAGTVAFGGSKRQSYPLTQFDRDSFRANAREIQHLKLGTPIYKVLEEAQAPLSERQGRAAIVIFSDGLVTDEFGRETEPGRTVAAATQLVAAYGGELCFHTVQIGSSEEGAQELRAIAETTSCGSHRTALLTANESQLHAFHREVFLAAGPTLPHVGAPAPAQGPWLVNFGLNSSEVDAMYQSQIDEVAAEIRRDPNASLRIKGYTDTSGDAAYNKALSMRRSEATRDALIRSGVGAGRIELRAYGEADPVVPNDDTEQERRSNRRTEIQIVR